MADRKWTPGPWTVMKDSRIIGFQFTSPRVWTKAEDKVADVEICILNPWEEWEDQRLADAHLIAAAPDLYEACEEALHALAVAKDRATVLGDTLRNMGASDQNRLQFETLMNRTADRIETALRKARGEE